MCYIGFMEFVALDFETANQYNDSAISLGLVRMDEEGKELDSWYSLICPPIPYFDPWCTSVHHLDSKEVLKAPRLNELWADIESFIGTSPLVAHNAAFDIGVLKGSTKAVGIELPNYEYYCTFQIARKLIPGLKTYSLSPLMQELFDYSYRAHLASDDALACAKLFAALCKNHLDERDMLEDFMRRRGCRYPKVIF